MDDDLDYELLGMHLAYQDANTERVNRKMEAQITEALQAAFRKALPGAWGSLTLHADLHRVDPQGVTPQVAENVSLYVAGKSGDKDFTVRTARRVGGGAWETVSNTRHDCFNDALIAWARLVGGA